MAGYNFLSIDYFRQDLKILSEAADAAYDAKDADRLDQCKREAYAMLASLSCVEAQSDTRAGRLERESEDLRQWIVLMWEDTNKLTRAC